MIAFCVVNLNVLTNVVGQAERHSSIIRRGLRQGDAFLILLADEPEGAAAFDFECVSQRPLM